MRFAVTLPWWGYALAVIGAMALAWLAYARVPVTLTPASRATLTALRFATLMLLLVILLRPVVMVPPAAANNSLLPILVDVSRSMRLTDDDGGPTRLDRAKAIVRDLQARVSSEYRIELLTFGETLAAATEVDRLAATARRSDLSGALADVGERYRNQRVAGIIVLSDGGDTAPQEGKAGRAITAPILTVGIGGTELARDREVVNLTAGEPLLPGASIDLSVSATSAGFGTQPVELRVSANGRPVDMRRVTPSADGAPIHQVFTVSPDPDVPTVYTVEIPSTSDELAGEPITILGLAGFNARPARPPPAAWLRAALRPAARPIPRPCD